jgi:hypothetical protein
LRYRCREHLDLSTLDITVSTLNTQRLGTLLVFLTHAVILLFKFFQIYELKQLGKEFNYSTKTIF